MNNRSVHQNTNSKRLTSTVQYSAWKKWKINCWHRKGHAEKKYLLLSLGVPPSTNLKGKKKTNYSSPLHPAELEPIYSRSLGQLYFAQSDFQPDLLPQTKITHCERILWSWVAICGLGKHNEMRLVRSKFWKFESQRRNIIATRDLKQQHCDRENVSLRERLIAVLSRQKRQKETE